jgi:molybdate transport repressor ModE-like protein
MLAARRLELLHAVAQAGSITAAAQRLAYSPSAVSQQLAALEREAGTRLVERLPRGVRLTDAGEALARHGEAIARHVRAAAEDLDALHRLGAGRVRIAAFPSAGATLVPRVVSDFTSRHPAIDVSLEVLEPREGVDALRDGVIDLALVFIYPFRPDLDIAGLEVQTSFDDEFLLAIAHDHALAGKTPIRAARLAATPWINSIAPDCARVLSHVASQGAFEPTVSFESNDYLTVGRLVAGGLGAALVPRLAVDAMPESVCLRPLRPAFTRRVALLGHGDPGPAVRAMLDVARPVFAAR